MFTSAGDQGVFQRYWAAVRGPSLARSICGIASILLECIKQSNCLNYLTLVRWFSPRLWPVTNNVLPELLTICNCVYFVKAVWWVRKESKKSDYVASQPEMCGFLSNLVFDLDIELVRANPLCGTWLDE